MVSLGPCQACTPAKVLGVSQDHHQLYCTERAITAYSTAIAHEYTADGGGGHMNACTLACVHTHNTHNEPCGTYRLQTIKGILKPVEFTFIYLNFIIYFGFWLMHVEILWLCWTN